MFFICKCKQLYLFIYEHLLEDQPHEMKHLVFMGMGGPQDHTLHQKTH